MQPNYILNKKLPGFNFSVTIEKDGQRIFYNGQITAYFRKQRKQEPNVRMSNSVYTRLRFKGQSHRTTSKIPASRQDIWNRLR